MIYSLYNILQDTGKYEFCQNYVIQFLYEILVHLAVDWHNFHKIINNIHKNRLQNWFYTEYSFAIPNKRHASFPIWHVTKKPW